MRHLLGGGDFANGFFLFIHCPMFTITKLSASLVSFDSQVF